MHMLLPMLLTDDTISWSLSLRGKNWRLEHSKLSESKNSFEGCKIEQEEDENFQQGLIDNQLEKCTGIWRIEKSKGKSEHNAHDADSQSDGIKCKIFFSLFLRLLHLTRNHITARHCVTFFLFDAGLHSLVSWCTTRRRIIRKIRRMMQGTIV